MLFFISAAVIQKAYVINGVVVSNRDIDQIRKLYHVLQSIRLPLIDEQHPESYFYRKIFLSQLQKIMQGKNPFEISDEEVKHYINFQLMQLGLSREQLDTHLAENNLTPQLFDECALETLKWFRYVAMNYGGLIKPSDKAISEFQTQVNKQIDSMPSTFINGFLVQVQKSQESLIDSLNIEAMLKARTKEAFLSSAKMYEQQPLQQVPLEAVTHPLLKQALSESYQTKKPVSCEVDEHITLVVYVTDGKEIKRTVDREQAAQMLTNDMITKKYSETALAQIVRKLTIQK